MSEPLSNSEASVNQDGAIDSKRLRIARSNERRSTIRRSPFRRLSSALAPGTRYACPAMCLRIGSVPSMVITVDLYTMRSTTASAVACSPSRSCQPAGAYCEYCTASVTPGPRLP